MIDAVSQPAPLSWTTPSGRFTREHLDSLQRTPHRRLVRGYRKCLIYGSVLQGAGRCYGILNEYKRTPEGAVWRWAWLMWRRSDSQGITYPAKVWHRYEREECARRARERD